MDMTPGPANHLPVSGCASADQHDSDPRRLRARAARYRRLADILCDETIIAIVLACADEFEWRADQHDDAKTPPNQQRDLMNVL